MAYTETHVNGLHTQTTCQTVRVRRSHKWQTVKTQESHTQNRIMKAEFGVRHNPRLYLFQTVVASVTTSNSRNMHYNFCLCDITQTYLSGCIRTIRTKHHQTCFCLLFQFDSDFQAGYKMSSGKRFLGTFTKHVESMSTNSASSQCVMYCIIFNRVLLNTASHNPKRTKRYKMILSNFSINIFQNGDHWILLCMGRSFSEISEFFGNAQALIVKSSRAFVISDAYIFCIMYNCIIYLRKAYNI